MKYLFYRIIDSATALAYTTDDNYIIVKYIVDESRDEHRSVYLLIPRVYEENALRFFRDFVEKSDRFALGMLVFAYADAAIVGRHWLKEIPVEYRLSDDMLRTMSWDAPITAVLAHDERTALVARLPNALIIETIRSMLNDGQEWLPLLTVLLAIKTRIEESSSNENIVLKVPGGIAVTLSVAVEESA